MSSTANLRLRRNAAQLTALAGVEREIRAQDSHGRRKYLREFSQAFRDYDSLLDSQQIQNALQSADVVLIGDYHALPAAQRYAASLVEQRALAGDRPVVLGVETIFARDQHILDEWWISTGVTTGLRSTNYWSPLATMPKRSTGSIACRVKTCARLALVTAMLPLKSLKSATGTQMQ
jgi:hypothetical protein